MPNKKSLHGVEAVFDDFYTIYAVLLRQHFQS